MPTKKRKQRTRVLTIISNLIAVGPSTTIRHLNRFVTQMGKQTAPQMPSTPVYVQDEGRRKE